MSYSIEIGHSVHVIIELSGAVGGLCQEVGLKLAQTLPSGSVVVTILCDNGNRYLSSDFWEEP